MSMLSLFLWSASALGLVLFIIQLVTLVAHRRRPSIELGFRPPISILRPLCGVDDDLASLLDEIARIDYPEYEVLLGVRDAHDSAYPLAVEAARRHHRLRVVMQRGAPGCNPKVNQLITLARAARHELLVVSDANVRLPAGYLDEVAAHLADSRVGLVTHPIAGDGARRLGALLDNLHMTASIGPGMIGAQRVSGQDLVVGKSMAMWRHDLARLGGFESVRDVLAEDYVLGSRISRVLHKRVVMAQRPVINLVRERSVTGFLDRYGRWAVLHRRTVGMPLYCAQLLLNPSLLAMAAALLSPSPRALLLLCNVLILRGVIDGASGLCLGRAFSFLELSATPLRDLALGLAWWRGLTTHRVSWRGNSLRVGPGTVLLQPEGPIAPAPREAANDERSAAA